MSLGLTRSQRPNNEETQGHQTKQFPVAPGDIGSTEENSETHALVGERRKEVKCLFHVGMEMLPMKAAQPKFAATTGEKPDDERIVYRCPLCTFVAMVYDPERKNPSLCRLCRKVSVLSGHLCTNCSRKYRMLHPRKRTVYVSGKRA
jgi:hypothetical protein